MFTLLRICSTNNHVSKHHQNRVGFWICYPGMQANPSELLRAQMTARGAQGCCFASSSSFPSPPYGRTIGNQINRAKAVLKPSRTCSPSDLPPLQLTATSQRHDQAVDAIQATMSNFKNSFFFFLLFWVENSTKLTGSTTPTKHLPSGSKPTQNLGQNPIKPNTPKYLRIMQSM